MNTCKPSPLTEPFFKAIPKVELHCHLFGSLRKATFEQLIKRSASGSANAEVAISCNATAVKRHIFEGVMRYLESLK